MAEPAIARDLLPEDAYDGDDPFDERLRVVERALDSILDDPDDDSRHARAMSILRLVDKLGDESLGLVDRITAARIKIRAAD